MILIYHNRRLNINKKLTPVGNFDIFGSYTKELTRIDTLPRGKYLVSSVFFILGNDMFFMRTV